MLDKIFDFSRLGGDYLDMISAVIHGNKPQVDAENAADVLQTAELILNSLQQ